MINCPGCESQNVGEGSIFDDMDGKLTCFSCGDRFERERIVKEVKPNKTFVIKHKTTGELFRAASGKTSWKAPGHAKNAWNQTINRWNAERYCVQMIGGNPPLFSEQDVYEVVELKLETESALDEAKNLLREILGRCDYSLNQKIEKFLEDNK